MIRTNGEKRPADPVAAGVHIGRLATGEAEEDYVNQERRASGRKGGKALDAPQRREVARRWGGAKPEPTEAERQAAWDCGHHPDQLRGLIGLDGALGPPYR